MPVFTLFVQLGGAILTRTLGWAGTLMFGRVPAEKRGVLVAILFGALLWALLLAAIVVPVVGAGLVASVPKPEFLPPSVLRTAMLAGVFLIPALIGIATIGLTRSNPRADGDGSGEPAGILVRILRGYPLTAVMAPLLGFLAVLAVTRKVRARSHGWTEAHVPFIVKPGGYETVARDLRSVLTAAGLGVAEQPAPASMSVPARVVAKVAGREAEALVPDRFVQLTQPDLQVLVYPSDLMIVGRADLVTRARATLASRLTTSAARQTASAEAQGMEDRIGSLGARARAGSGLSPDARMELRAIDDELARRDLPFDDWQVVYRERLQVERDLRAVSMDGRLEPADGLASAPIARSAQAPAQVQAPVTVQRAPVDGPPAPAPSR